MEIEMIEVQIKEMQAKNIREFLDAVEILVYDQQNEFNTTECVICMD